MPYSDFTIERVQQDFNIEVIEDHDLFFHVKEVEVSSILMEALEFTQIHHLILYYIEVT